MVKEVTDNGPPATAPMVPQTISTLPATIFRLTGTWRRGCWLTSESAAGHTTPNATHTNAAVSKVHPNTRLMLATNGVFGRSLQLKLSASGVSGAGCRPAQLRAEPPPKVCQFAKHTVREIDPLKALVRPARSDA